MLFNLSTGESDLFRDLEQFRNEVNRLFNSAAERYAPGSGTAQGGTFPVNLYASEEELVLTAEMPGVAPEDVNLTLEQNLLTLSFKRELPAESKDMAYHRRERASGTFSRSIELPVRIDAERVQARADNGVLQVQLPRLAEDKPRKISIRAQS